MNVSRLGHCNLVFVAALLSATALPAQDSTRSSGWVVISVDEYRSLRNRAFPPEREPAAPPLDATLTRADYDLRIDGSIAAGKAALTIDVLKDGWVRVPVPSGVLVREARLDGKLVSLIPGSGGKGTEQLSAILSRPGRSVLSLDIILPVVATAGTEVFSLPTAPSGITKATVLVPRPGIDLKLEGGLLTEKWESASETRWTAYGRGNEPLSFTWHRKSDDQRNNQPLRLRGSITQLIRLGEESGSLQAEVNVAVAQGSVREIRVRLPDKVTINQVTGAVIADWETKPGELSVTFLEPVEHTAGFLITGEAALPREGQIGVPLLRLIDAERETGGVAVEVLGAGEIKQRKSQGLDDADASELGEMAAARRSPSMRAFRFRTGDFKVERSLEVEVARYSQQAVLTANIEEAHYRVLMSREGRTLVQARFAVRNNQRNFVKMTLPAGGILWTASLSGNPVRPGQAPDGSLLLPLEKTRGEESRPFVVEVLYLAAAGSWTESGKVRIPLPAMDLAISRTGLLIYHPPVFRVKLEPGVFRLEREHNPVADVLNLDSEALSKSTLPSSSESAGPGQSATQDLISKYLARNMAARSGSRLPVRVSFPALGPSIFLASELNAENQSPVVELSYQREKKGRAR
jgi:hypothetical protein